MKNNQLKLGMKVEAEHKPTYNFLKKYVKVHGKLPPEKLLYKNIAKNHIAENKLYYTKLRRLKL